jgi:hypothetical protein
MQSNSTDTTTNTKYAPYYAVVSIKKNELLLCSQDLDEVDRFIINCRKNGKDVCHGNGATYMDARANARLNAKEIRFARRGV